MVEVRILDERVRAWGGLRYHSAMAAALDLYACVDAALTLEPQAPARLVPAGIALHIADARVAAMIVPRSGNGHRRGLVLGNTIGVIDADYTGPVLISVWNRSALDGEPIRIEPGDRIAQLLFVPIVRPEFRIVAEFSQVTERGSGGFGSTG